MDDFWRAPGRSVITADAFDHREVFAKIVSQAVVVMDNSIASVKERRTSDVVIGRDEKTCWRVPFLFPMS